MPVSSLTNPAVAVWRDPESFATALFFLYCDRYVPDDPPDAEGNGCLDWLPDTIRDQLFTDYGVQIPETNIKKLCAAISIATSNAFFVKPDVFVPLANAIAGSDPDPSVFEPADAAECAWAVLESQVLSQEEEDWPWSPEVEGYIKSAISQDGLSRPPKILGAFAEPTGFDVADEDPELAEAVFTSQESSVSDIDQAIKDSVSDLIRQLETLPLQHGSTRSTVEKLRRLRV